MSYFSDNQSKQTAYDRYYNAVARSGFKQGRKLQALIKQEAADDAQTDQLASMCSKATYKAREYEYDAVSKKLKKAAPPIVKGKTGDNRTGAPSKNKDGSVPDTDTEPAEFDDFYKNVNEMAKKALRSRAYVKKGRTLREVVDAQVRDFLNKRREYRKEDSSRRRQEMADKFAEKVMKESEAILKRKRTETPPNKSPTDKRAYKRATTRDDDDEPPIARNLFQDDAYEDSSDDEEVKEEKRLKSLNAGIK